MERIPIGTKGIKKAKVSLETLASSIGSGTVDVLSTPNLLLLIEKACIEAIKEYLNDGETSVGTLVHIRHLSAVPPGLEVTATAILTEIKGRKLVFDAIVFDEFEKIGEGVHERFLVNEEKFSANALKKLDIHKGKHI